jgi:cytochrome c2
VRARLVAVAIAIAIAFAVLAIACGHHAPGDAPGTGQPEVVEGDAIHGRQLVDHFECARCHTVANVPEPPKDKQCVGCHHDIDRGAVKATPEQLTRWQGKVAELGDVPSLAATGGRFRRAWLKDFLLHPHDLRPGLRPTMPRLAMTEQQATDLATYLSPIDESPKDDAATVLAGALATRGRELMDTKGCGLCHQMTGVAPLHPGLLPTGVTVPDMARAVRLAPDLRFARDRWHASLLVRWLEDPALVKPDTPMPKLGLSGDEAKAIAAYLVTAPLAPQALPPVPARLPGLARKVTYDEVATRIFRKTCWHCHGEPDFERGDGGPGNSGGFGFPGRRLNLSDYASTFAGFLEQPERSTRRTSVFAPTKDGTPYVVAAMIARQEEESGKESALRGMPLGLPALPAEDVQLVETWIAQGRPR